MSYIGGIILQHALTGVARKPRPYRYAEGLSGGFQDSNLSAGALSKLENPCVTSSPIKLFLLQSYINTVDERTSCDHHTVTRTQSTSLLFDSHVIFM